MADDALGRLITRAEQQERAWAGGRTRAIYAAPADGPQGPGDAAIWVGTATIERDSDYSHFPGRQRVHMPLAGGGLRLRFQAPAELVELHNLAQHRFGGARPVRAELLGGPVLAFNLIARDDLAATVTALTIGVGELGLAAAVGAPGPGGLRLLYAARGALAIILPDRPAVTLADDEAFLLHPPGGQEESLAVRGLEPGSLIIGVAVAAP